ncbi:MAG TPA: ribosomal RNA small subunit methyltransferase A [Verrucomicrobia bacterium]|nr:MAG: ribosomal RNA small subunit methyltransferase A [Lentisphaerae bacterium GWF2_57_35]HBA85667.1 ribosomal RNA small subunit methyltransferase A [Verrucomicrobiota bacterium]
MKLTRPSEVKALLQELEFQPSKVLGQNFLIDGNILRILVDAAEIHPGDQVLEVGPGLGVLTEEIIARGARLIAVEKDKRLYAYLLTQFAQGPDLEFRNADILEVDLNALLVMGVNKVVANLPYSVGSRFLVDLFEAERAVEGIVVTVQKEVGARLAARSGSSDYGLLSVLAQLRYEVSMAKTVSPSCFYPPPEVTSAIVRLKVKPQSPSREEMIRTRKLLKLCFSARRKQLLTTLRGYLQIDSKSQGKLENLLHGIGIGPKVRPEEIPPYQWRELGRSLLGYSKGGADEKSISDAT